MRKLLAVLFPSAFMLAVACNAITGEHDRALDNGLGAKDSGGKQRAETGTSTTPPPSHGGDDGGNDIGAQDAGVTEPPPAVVVDSGGPDAEPPPPTTITLGTSWVTPNNAKGIIQGTTTRITGFTSPMNHPMILPNPPPALPTNYKVVARIRADERSEFGVLVRGRNTNTGFAAVVLSSRFSEDFLNPPRPNNRPFLAPIAVATDNPEVPPGVEGTSYLYSDLKVWVFEVEAKDAIITGKIFQEDNPAINSTMVFTDPQAPADRGRQVGYITYGAPNATLLDYKITF